ncbi:MAG: ribonuclease HII [Coriobacteriia bacterium]|nr:ribonuclease HII [Coriobacteriia bacterium]
MSELSVAEVRLLLATANGAEFDALCKRLADDPRSGVVSALAGALRRQEAITREAARMEALYALEHSLRESGCRFVAGVDEVGRGALAGPLTVGAVVLHAAPMVAGLDDSKRLTPARRDEIAVRIHAEAVAVSIAHVEAAEIDVLGMTAALRLAMRRAIDGLACLPDHVIIDGRPMGVADPETAVVKGDSKVAAIAAASIVAKVARDNLMRELGPLYPEFEFAVNKGYGTAEHMDAVRRLGPTPHHRRSFSGGGGDMTLF